jgi:hypothetical protein
MGIADLSTAPEPPELWSTSIHTSRIRNTGVLSGPVEQSKKHGATCGSHRPLSVQRLPKDGSKPRFPLLLNSMPLLNSGSDICLYSLYPYPRKSPPSFKHRITASAHPTELSAKSKEDVHFKSGIMLLVGEKRIFTSHPTFVRWLLSL